MQSRSLNFDWTTHLNCWYMHVLADSNRQK